MAQEIEVKLRILSGTEEEILASLSRLLCCGAFEQHALGNSYYDTPDQQLHSSKIALRIRQKGAQFIQTLKTKGQVVKGLHQRGEWEWAITGQKLESTCLAQCQAWPKYINTDLLTAVFETNFRRFVTNVVWKGIEVELAFDIGYILANGRKLVINEIELELLSGDLPEALPEKASILLLQELSDYLANNMAVEVYDVSKAERGYELYLQTQHEKK